MDVRASILGLEARARARSREQGERQGRKGARTSRPVTTVTTSYSRLEMEATSVFQHHKGGKGAENSVQAIPRSDSRTGTGRHAHSKARNSKTASKES